MVNPVKYRYLILGFTVLLLLFSATQIPKLRAVYDFESFFPQGDPTLKTFERYKEIFNADENFLMLGIPNEPSVFDTIFLKKIQKTTLEIAALPQMVQAQSLVTMKTMRKTPFGFREFDVLPINEATLANDSAEIMADKRAVGFFISEKSDVLTVMMELVPSISEGASDSLVTSIREICAANEVGEYHIGGDSFTKQNYVEMLEEENKTMIPLFMGAVIFMLWLLYGSWFQVIVPTISVVVGLIILYGYAATIGRYINLSTLMYPTIMLIVGMSDLIHLYTKYEIEIRKGFSKEKAILNSLTEIRFTLFITSLTTIIGFLTISQSSMPHVATFGWDGAVGVALAFLIAITFTPVVLYLLPVPKARQERMAFFNVDWQKWLLKIFEIGQQKRKTILGVSALFLIIAVIGITKIDTNNYVLGAIDEETELRKDYSFFEEHLSGVRSFELFVELKNGHKADDLAVLKALDKLELFLETQPTVGPIISPLTFYKSINEIRKGKYELPSNQSAIKVYNRFSDTLGLQNYISLDKQSTRFTGKMKDVGRLKVKAFNTDLQTWAAANLPEEMCTLTMTGAPVLIDRNNELLIGQMLYSLGIAFLLISLIMAFLYRDVKMVIISLIPNVLPLIMVAGVMGWLGVELNGSVSIIFTLAFVIAVDDTIHFLSKFKKEVTLNGYTALALQNTIVETGKAIVMTSIILMSGYAVLFFSDFKEAWYHGVLICFTLFWAVLADLFLLPILLSKLKVLS